MAQLNFSQCHQDTHDIGGDNRMTSQVTFSINNEPEVYVCTVRQNLGPGFKYADEPLEVDVPEELKDRFPYEPFRQAVENYYRMCVGGGGGGAGRIRMRNNLFKFPYTEVVREKE